MTHVLLVHLVPFLRYPRYLRFFTLLKRLVVRMGCKTLLPFMVARVALATFPLLLAYWTLSLAVRSPAGAFLLKPSLEPYHVLTPNKSPGMDL